jgi:hypothetical protein
VWDLSFGSRKSHLLSSMPNNYIQFSLFITVIDSSKIANHRQAQSKEYKK